MDPETRIDTMAETMLDALRLLEERGYSDDLELQDGKLRRTGTDETHPLDEVVVDHTFRFEGDTDPADESIVLGLSLPRWESKGVLVSAYGPEANQEDAVLLARLAQG